MIPIKILGADGRVLAHHTADHPRSSYGTLIWSIEETPEEGAEILWIEGETRHKLTVVGVVDGWLVVKQEKGLLAGIIWSDGSYHAGLIVDRVTEEPAAADADLESGEYIVKGTIAYPGSVLGMILM